MTKARRFPIKFGDKTFYMDEDNWKREKTFREEKERNLKPMSLK